MKGEVMKEKKQEKSFSIECDVMCKTEQQKSLKYRFVWVIEKFSELSQPTGEFIESCDLIFKALKNLNETISGSFQCPTKLS